MDPDESNDQFNLGTMLLIALAAVVGTTLTVWALHFMHYGTVSEIVAKPFPRIAVLPFHSLSAAPDDISYDRRLTAALIVGLGRISRVEALPPETDTDPVVVGREFGVKIMLIGKVKRLGSKTTVSVQMVSAKDGRQIWAGSFDGEADDVGHLASLIESGVAPHLTALLD